MFKNKSIDGKNNICGNKIAKLRMQHVPKMSQRALADKLQLFGLDVDKNAISKMECGDRFITDIELVAIANVFGVSITELFNK